MVAAVAAVLGAALWGLSRFDAKEVGPVVGLLSFALGLLGVIWTAARRSAQRARPSTPEQRDKAARWLADEVRLRLQDETTYRALSNPEPLALRWRVRDPVFHMTRDEEPAGEYSGPHEGEGSRALLDWLSRVGSRRIALIGQPGSGKTSLAGLVAREVLDNRRDWTDPIPVLIPLADWNPNTASLNQWISLRLAAEFPRLAEREIYGSDAALALVLHGYIFPILDGLDEVRSDIARFAVEHIRKWSYSTPLVVTCRTEEFEAVTSGARLAPRMNTVELKSLDAADVANFLDAAIEDKAPSHVQRWTRLVQLLRSRSDDTLMVSLSTPLIVWLLWATYIIEERDPSVLLDRKEFQSATKIENHILAAFVSTVFAERSLRGVVRSERWLQLLARQSASGNITAIAWWQVPQMVPRLARRLGTVAAAAILMTPLALMSDAVYAMLLALLLGLVPRLEPASTRFRGVVWVRSWPTTHDRLRRSTGIGTAVFASVCGFGVRDGMNILLILPFGLRFGMIYSATSEWVQRGFGYVRDMLHLPLRTEERDAPPPASGISLDWSRAALVISVGIAFAARHTADGVLASIMQGVIFALALSPFAWFGKSALSTPLHRQREIFRANLRYSMTRGVLIALALLVGIGLAYVFGNGVIDESFAGDAREVIGNSIVVLVGAALWFGAASVLIAPSGQYLLSVGMLAAIGKIPWRPIRFLRRVSPASAVCRHSSRQADDDRWLLLVFA